MIDHLGVLDYSINSDVSEHKLVKANVRKKSSYSTESGITSKKRKSKGMKMITHIQEFSPESSEGNTPSQVA